MFNRANKMTALLVAAAAVVSLVPATGVNAADKYERINSKDGKVYHAVAFKDGQFYFDGEVDDKDEAAYYLSNGKSSAIDGIDTNSKTSTFGEKYVDVQEGDYFVDLTTGKVDDEDLREQGQDDAEAALKKKIKDKADDRYQEDNEEPTAKEILASNKFGESWYATTYKANKATNGKQIHSFVSATSAGVKNELNVYTDIKGNYIDADYNLGKIRVSTTGSSVNVENTDKQYNLGEDVTKNLKASVEQKAIIGQDAKNIYRYAEVSLIVDTNKSPRINEINGKTLTEMGVSTTTVGTDEVIKLPVIQKISKEQSSDTIDGAKYARNVNTYVISKDKGLVATVNGGDNFDDCLDYLEEIANPTAGIDTKATIVNGKVIIHSTYENASGDKVIDAQAISLKTKAGWYYTDCEDAKVAEDIAYSDDSDCYAVDVDCDGNVWRIDGGFVYKFDNTDDWDKVYKVDGSMDQLSVYNKDNMVAWNEDDEVYSVIGQKEEKEEDKKPEVEVKAGWNQAADGTWTFVKDGVKATGWLQDGANWYLLNEAGIMQTGWQTVGGTWYYLAGNGAMQTGWQNINGAWYFLQGSGAMQTGWINDNGTWYFADGSGKMLANTTVNGYVLGANGAWVK